MGSKCFPPGFRFHPTDEELVLYYLKRKICRRSTQMDIIAEVDVYKWDPEELPGLSKLKTGDRQWFFFSPRDRKYPNGGRSSRATRNGYWKATGKDRTIKQKSSSVGNIKTLVYYQGRAPSGLRTDWVMHEYTLDEEELKRCPSAQEHYVLSKIFKKSGAGPKNGEQYGAPFVEEEWEDEDCLDVESLLAQKPISGPEPGPGPLNNFESINKQEETGFSDDIVAFLHKIIDQPEALPEPVPEGSTSHVEKDFLEIDDLIGPEMGACDPVTDFNSLSEFDFYHNMENLEFGPGPGGPENGHEFFDELPVSYDLWNHCDQNVSSMTSMQTVSKPVSNPSSGVVIEGNVTKPEYYLNQCPENMDNNNPDSQFSSALWAFVDSIPTTPASASESSALVNRAYKRISSFSKGRNVNLASVASTTSRNIATTRLGKPSSSRSIVFFSVLGVLFAILWVFVGSSIELLNRFVWL